MLACDSLAALSTIAVLVLLKGGWLAPWHMYLLNALSGLMNTVQQPASDVAMTLITPPRWYQKTSGLRSLSNSLVTILNPILATAVFAFAGMDGVIFLDLLTFGGGVPGAAAWGAAAPGREGRQGEPEPFWATVRSGLGYLGENRMILLLILFLAGVNFVASAFDAALPALILPKENGGEAVLGMVSSCAGIATLVGSLLCVVLPAPKNRIRVISLTMLFSLGTENFLLAFSRSPWLWCLGQLIGWLLVPLMNANLDVVLRKTIPVEMQGRVYACRNSLQFCTIPLGLLAGGALIDGVCEPWMASLPPGACLSCCLAQARERGSAAAVPAGTAGGGGLPGVWAAAAKVHLPGGALTKGVSTAYLNISYRQRKGNDPSGHSLFSRLLCLWGSCFPRSVPFPPK